MSGDTYKLRPLDGKVVPKPDPTSDREPVIHERSPTTVHYYYFQKPRERDDSLPVRIKLTVKDRIAIGVSNGLDRLDAVIGRIQKSPVPVIEFTICTFVALLIGLAGYGCYWVGSALMAANSTVQTNPPPNPASTFDTNSPDLAESNTNTYSRDVAAIKRAVLADTIVPRSAQFCPKFEVLKNNRQNLVYVGWYRSEDLRGIVGQDNIVAEVDGAGTVVKLSIGDL